MTSHLSRTHFTAYLQALAAALLFGLSAPLAKLLLGDVAPVPLAALLYLGCGLALAAYAAVGRVSGLRIGREARITPHDLPWIAGATLAGGVAAPIILLISLRFTPAATASLLLNFEAVATTLLAGLLWAEALGRRVWAAVAIITLASIVLSWGGAGLWGVSAGAVGILAACALWGLDNNLMRQVSGKDPVLLAAIKGLAAATISFGIAAVARQALPTAGPALLALLVGGLSYGLSMTLFITAMRHLGAARTSALYGTAPFTGALLSLLIFPGSASLTLLLAAPLMILGTVLLLGEQHGHEHRHDPLEHAHAHRHDDGHHDHGETHDLDAGVTSHAHPHLHPETAHTHGHAPDLHHRHGH